ncbi:sulfatase [Methylovulum sp.]|uniref:sulfatase family protein n=1 Tax=Methylovulum sp. TaxID=1916980 RepID=UPI00260B7F2C|nr:sulfatase [Methylovulum sp.]
MKINSLLTANGMTFKNNFVSLSLCCPSRTSTLRGQYAHNTGLFKNNPPDGGFGKIYSGGLEKSTVATWLQNAGYRTALIGKYLNGYPSKLSGISYIPPGWTYWVSPNQGEPYSEFNYSLNENGKTVTYGNADKDYMVDVLADKTTQFIGDTTSKYPGKPFFIFLAPYLPHQPATAPLRYANDFPNVKAPRPASFNEADVSDKPAWVQAKPLLTSQQIANIDILYRRQRQSMQAVGDLVENVVNKLRAVGELNNTYVFITSDNGFHLGQHRLNSGKNTAFEEDINVPLVVRGPGVAAGSVVSEITANVDFAPTFAKIAGITPPAFVDGRSLLPILHGITPTNWRKVLLLEHASQSITSFSADPLLEPQDEFDIQAAATYDPSAFAGLRTQERAIGNYGPINYIEYDTGERELYRLWPDPLQVNNEYLIMDQWVKYKLKLWLGKLRTASGQALRNAEQTAP